MSNNDSGFRPAPRKKIPLDNTKIHLSAPNQKGKRASMQFGLINNNPRITVFTNDPDDTQDYGKIVAALDAPTFFAYIGAIHNAIKATGKWRVKFDNKKTSWSGGKPSEAPVVTSSLLVGRDEDGTIWTSVSAPRRPNIKFVFGPSEFHSVVDGDGAVYDKAKLSQMYAEAHAQMLSQLMAGLLITEYVPPKPKEDGGNNRGGQDRGNSGGGNRQQSSGGNNASADDMENDIPW